MINQTSEQEGTEILVRELSFRIRNLVTVLGVVAVIVLGIFGVESATRTVGFVYAQDAGVCDRTHEVYLSIVDWLPGPDKLCEEITDTDLASLTDFSVEGYPSLTSLQSGDFAGMGNITRLRLQRNQLEELPADIFEGLDLVTDLRIGRNNLTDLPDGIFAGLPALATLTADGNYFTRIKASWFDGFEGGGTLSRFEWVGNDISRIDADALDGFTGLTRFYLSYNKLRTLPSGLFEGLPNLLFVSLHFNEINSLPADLFDRLTDDGSVGSNSTLQRIILSDNNLSTLPSGLLDNLQGLQQFRVHRNRITSLPGGLFDNNPLLWHLDLSHNRLTSLPTGMLANNSIMYILDLNDNSIASLDGIGLAGLHEMIWFRMQNNELAKLPDAYVSAFVEDANADPPTKYCLVELRLDNNPFSESWIAGGDLNEFLTAYGGRDPKGPADCFAVAADVTAIDTLGLGGIDLGVTVDDGDDETDDKTAWQLLTEDFTDATKYVALHDFSFGWDGLTIDETVLAALPTQLETLFIRDATFDTAVTGATFSRFTRTQPVTTDLFFRRPDDLVLSINYAFGATYTATAGLQVLELDNVGLTGDGSSILGSLPAATIQQLTVKNNPGLTSVPSSITNLTNLKGLEFQNTGVTSLGANAFSGLSDLYFLSFEDNEIDTIDEDAFDGLSAVQILFLNGNEIETLESGVLSDMTALRQVLIDDNDLLTLSSSLFSGLENLDTIQLHDNPGSPFSIGVSVVDDTTDDTMSQLNVREGAPYSFVAKIVEDEVVTSVVPLDAGATMTAEAFALPEDAEVELPSMLREWHGSDYEFCLGLDECFSGFEFVLNPRPSIVAMSFVNPEQLFTAGDKLRFKAQFDTRVEVEGMPQLSFELGDQRRYADYVEDNSHSTLYFEYTLQSTDPTPDRVSMANSMLFYPRGSSIKDPLTQTVANARPRRTEATSEALTTTSIITFNTGPARITKIVPSIESVTVSGGDRVKLEVDVYGAQGIKDNGLGESVGFLWNDGDAGGAFDGNGREVTYTAPESAGRYTVDVATPFSACRAPTTAEVRCATSFEIVVRRASANVAPAAEPRNPDGVLPTILTDSNGNQYEVFTPVDGGTFTSDASTLSAGPGVVPNGEILGLRISEGSSASNEGRTHQRYTLGGLWYDISAVDAEGAIVASYQLKGGLDVCVPLPAELRSNIADLALVAVNADDSLTILSSRVRISTSGTKVCGRLSAVPATLAVGIPGAPSPLPTADSGSAQTGLPDTGAPTFSSVPVALWVALVGLTVLLIAFGMLRRSRRNRPTR